MTTLKTLVVDDSSAYRIFLKRVVQDIDSCSYLGSAIDGKDAVDQIEKLKPELITLDIEMPGLDGLGVLKVLKERQINIPVIVISSITTAHSKATIAALELGAFDFITKPVGQKLEQSHEMVKSKLADLITCLKQKKAGAVTRTVSAPVEPRVVAQPAAIPDSFAGVVGLNKPKIMTVGVSTGGPQALTQLFENLPGQLGIPVLVVQHMPEFFTRSLAESLDKKTALSVVEAEDGQSLQPNTVYIAPGGYQMKVVGTPASARICITDDEKDEHSKPSVNYLFDSVADVFRGDVLALIMTGLGCDGTRGLTQLKSRGARVLAQDEASCVAPSMPKSAKEAGVVDEEVPLGQLAKRVVDYL